MPVSQSREYMHPAYHLSSSTLLIGKRRFKFFAGIIATSLLPYCEDNVNMNYGYYKMIPD